MTTMQATRLAATDVDTPVGAFRVATDGGRLVAAAFADHWERLGHPVPGAEADASIVDAVGRYLDGDLGAIDDLEVTTAGTPFQQQVWRALRAIPVGTTASYADVAAAVGRPSATRAVGTANGANPIWLIVPCHRVIRADGSIGGYGGGEDRKRWLLAHEGAI